MSEFPRTRSLFSPCLGIRAGFPKQHQTGKFLIDS